MGIYGALATAVTGMSAQSFALENISGNIANSQTTGYKRMETGFIDLIPDAAVGRQVPGAVLAYSRSTNDVRGDIVTSPTGTHVALNGSGFFVVAEKTGTTDGESVFGDANFYTRRGDFEMDREGYLHNGAGYYLKGVPVDPSTGNVAGSVPQMVRVSNGLIAAKATQRIDYELNLPAVPAVGLAAVPASRNSSVQGMSGASGVRTDMGWSANDTFTLQVGTGAVQTFTEGVDGTSLQDIIDWVNTSVPGATASINASNELEIVADNGTDNITVGGDAAALAGLGVTGSGTPTVTSAGGMSADHDLVTDLNWTAPSGTISLSVNGGGSVNMPVNGSTTLQDIIDWVNGTVDGASATIDADGRLSISADRIDESLTMNGTASLLTALGITAGTANAPADPETGTDFLARTVEGGAITVYAPNGASVNVQMRWGKLSNEPDTWQLYYMSNSEPQEWAEVDGAEFTFRDGVLQTHDGSTVSLNDPLRLELPNLTINGTMVGSVELDFGAGGLTQFDNANGRASVSTLAQDGYPAGSFMSVAINDAGRVVATYSNGEQIEIFQLVTANFNAENQLKRLDGGVYSATAASGEAILSTDGGMTGGALETSNTDISEEFTKLIVTQQAYAAGTRIVSTSDEMLQEALNMMR